jgi:hypothetical protein
MPSRDAVNSAPIASPTCSRASNLSFAIVQPPVEGDASRLPRLLQRVKSHAWRSRSTNHVRFPSGNLRPSNPCRNLTAITAMGIHRLLLISVIVALASIHPGEAMDAAGGVPAPHDPKTECQHLQKLCRDARAAKQDAEEAMAKSRAFHERAKAMLPERNDEERDDLRREGHEVQVRLTSASHRRSEAAAAFMDAVRAVTARRGVRPACASCPGIAEGRAGPPGPLADGP